MDSSREPSPRQKKATETRQRIFEAVREIVREDGMDGLTTKRICERAQVSNGTLFYHFKTKTDLLSYYLEDGFDRYYDEHALAHGSVREEVISGFLLYADYCQKMGVDFLREYYAGTNAALDTRPEALGRPLLNHQMEAAAKALATRMDDEEAKRVAADLCTIVKGCILEWCVSDGATDLSGRIERLLNRYLDSALK